MRKVLLPEHFIKNYRLPLGATLLFLIIVGVMLFARVVDRMALADIMGDPGNSDNNYATLVNNDLTDDLKKNDIGQEDQPSQASVKSNQEEATPVVTSVAETQAPFTISPGGSTPTPTPSPPTGTIPVIILTPFSASIKYLRHESTSAVTCNGVLGPIFGGGLNPANCYKKYFFGAGIDTLNGPGVVNYKWQSSLASANTQSSFAVGPGTAFTALSKEIVITCDQNTSFNLKLQLTSPTETSSGVLTVQHRC